MNTGIVTLDFIANLLSHVTRHLVTQRRVTLPSLLPDQVKNDFKQDINHFLLFHRKQK